MLIVHYVDYMRLEKGLSKETIKKRTLLLKDFFRCLEDGFPLHQLDISHVDKILETYNTDSYSRRTLQSYTSVIRTFFTYAEGRGWCPQGLAKLIKTARIYKHETLPYSPLWEDVQRLLKTTVGPAPTDIRDRAILMLLAIYGLRSGEVVKLRLDDLNWKADVDQIQSVITVRQTKFYKARLVPFGTSLSVLICEYIEWRKKKSFPQEGTSPFFMEKRVKP
jgi:site-specific recombinase XerD